ncbi:MAG: hypothetical protein PHD60_11850 [Clostridia bacterium]|nr:hypothetical protein [Clostridia bacterium]
MKLIFAVESDWEGSAKKQSSILPMLQCINGIYPSIKYIFRTANTKEELRYCLTKFKQLRRKNGDFCAFFYSGHGSTGKIHLGKEILTLSDLAKVANDVEEGLFDGHLVHFDSCSVVRNSDVELKEFINSTGASLVTGFDRDVDFIESLALEMIFIDYISDNKPYTAYKKIIKNYSELCNRTGFIAVKK